MPLTSHVKKIMTEDNKKNNISKWEMKNSRGVIRIYEETQIVSKDGNQYVATRRTSGFSPEHGEKRGWKKVSTNRTINYTESSNKPNNPIPGDEWLNLSNGIMYKYFDDGNSKQWVSIT